MWAVTSIFSDSKRRRRSIHSSRSPAAKIAEEREKLAKYKAVKQQIVDQLAGYTKQG